MILGRYVLDLFCSNHVTCSAKSTFTADSREECVEKAKNKGWKFKQKTVHGHRQIDECTCLTCWRSGK